MKIRELRERRGTTQTKLARAMEAKQSSVAQWEKDESMPTAAKLLRLATILRSHEIANFIIHDPRSQPQGCINNKNC